MITAENVTLVSVDRDDPIILSFTVTQTVPPVEPTGILWTLKNSGGVLEFGNSNGGDYILSNDRLTLTILKAKRAHAGTYIVNVRNAVGTNSAQITLLVIGGR